MNWSSIEKRLLFLMLVTDLHSGMGKAVSGAVDNPIQRGSPAYIPLIRGSSIKGALSNRYFKRVGKRSRDEKEIWAPIFGDVDESAASFTVLDAHPLLIPVPSLKGGYAYVTSPALLNRFALIADMTGKDMLVNEALEALAPGGREPCGRECYVEEESKVLLSVEALQNEECVVIEPLLVLKPARRAYEISKLTRTLIRNSQALNIALEVEGHVVLISDDMLSLVLEHVITATPRIRLKYKEKVVETGPWWEETLPKGTLLYTAFIARNSRIPLKREVLKGLKKFISFRELGLEIDGDKAEIQLKPSHIFQIALGQKSPLYLFLGADKSSGKGLIKVIWYGRGIS